MLARIAARAFDGAPLRSLRSEFALLVIAFLLRGAFAWAMEVAGRRAAWSVLSELRLALVEKRLRTQPAAIDGTDGAEITTVSVQGVEALEGYFARYLPQAVLASVVPFLVIAWVAFVDLEAAVIMLLTLPLVPVFMWLIGPYTEQVTRERWQALRQLSSHFLDVVRGLPTLRAFGRGQDEAANVAEVSERYRRATMGTLRISFLSGSVLELAATIGVALVAVTAGVRLVGGSLGLQAGLTVIVLAPELYLPFRRLGAEYHASADGLAVAERMFALLDAPAAVGPGGRRLAPSPAQRHGRARAGVVLLSRPVRPRCSTGSTWSSRPARSWRWSARAAPVRAPSRRCCSGCSSRPGVGSPSAASICRECRAGRVAPARRLGAPASDAVPRDGRRQHPARRSGRARRDGHRGRAARRRGRVHPARSRTATRRSSATGSGRSRRASAGGSGSRARSCETRRS